MKAAAFFDMDGTLLRGESQFTFLIWLARRRFVPVSGAMRVLGMYLLYLAGVSANAHKLRQAGFRLLRGNSDAALRTLGEEFLTSCLAKRIRRFAPQYVEEHRRTGHQVVLVTSAADIVARPVARHFCFDAIIATQLEIAGGKLTGAITLPEPYAAGKRQMVEAYCRQNGFPSAECFAYTDHHSDVALLESVGQPRVVNPTKKLRKISGQRSWRVLDFDQPLL